MYGRMYCMFCMQRSGRKLRPVREAGDACAEDKLCRRRGQYNTGLMVQRGGERERGKMDV